MRRVVAILLLGAVCHSKEFQPRPWDDYRVIMWVGGAAYEKPDKLPLFFQRLREMGVNTAMVHGDADPKPLLDNHFPYYVENIINRGLCLKWNSTVRDWDKLVTAWKGPRDKATLVRDYCLDAPAWRDWARNQMRSVVKKNAPHMPLAYDIRDEPSVTYSANPFDYDFNPITLKTFREWLKTQYANLAALNAGWETTFATWDQVMPFTTDEIKNRMASGKAIPRGKPNWQALRRVTFDPVEARKNLTRWNLSPWCDFRTYMDISLAGTLDEIRKASHEIDARTPVGIEGTQMPHAFGGYDLWRLSQVLDWVEPYDIGNARDIFGSFMPDKPILTTVGGSDANSAKRRLWHLLLEGDRGCIIWWSDDSIDLKSDDYVLTAKAKALAPLLKEMTGPLARVFLRAEREYDPIGIHYSQPSVQVDWLIESGEDGSTWLRRFSSYEASRNKMAKDRDECLYAVRDAGFSPRFVSQAQVESGTLAKMVLLLPLSYALSDKEALQIRKGSAMWSGVAGAFDEHGRLREKPLFEPAPAATWSERVAKLLPAIPREVSVTSLSGEPHAAIWRYRIGQARLVAFERNVHYHTSEDLKQRGGNEALERPIELEATFARMAYVYDLRAKKYLGQTDHISFRLDPWQPSLFALLPEQVPAETLIESLLKN
jgi:Beta-galactosidase